MLGLHPTDRPIARPDDVPEAKSARALLHLALIARGIYIARRGYVSLSLPQDEADDAAFAAAVADAVATHGRVLRENA
jgi:glutamate-1-semialdehyde 2,1-aminomutase